MTLYNCKIDGDSYRITKFDSNLEVEASYLTTHTECECPAGHRPTCRHRKMLPMFLGRKADQGQWFLDFDRLQWHKAEAEILGDLDDQLEASYEAEAGPSPAMIEASATRTINLLDLAKMGITVLPLDNVGAVHNTIAEAVGEPSLPNPPKPMRRI